jgi:hypothetical protein
MFFLSVYCHFPPLGKIPVSSAMNGREQLPFRGKFGQCYSTTGGPDWLPARRVAQGDFPSWCQEDYHRGPSAADSAMPPARRWVLGDFPSWYLAPL